MPFWSAPPRQRGVEILDDPRTPDHHRREAMRFLTASNTLFGGMTAVTRALRDAVLEVRAPALVLDVGTGMGDIAWRVAELVKSAGTPAHSIGLDLHPSLIAEASHFIDFGVAGDALRLPFADESIDIVICSQLLHHFFDDHPSQLIGELHRVSRDWVVISDLRRSRIAAHAFALAARVLRFHAITRHDGVTSVLRGFTADELNRLVIDATGVTPQVRAGRFWRLTATWRKSISRHSEHPARTDGSESV